MKMNGQQGFTLIELMIVIAIIGILAAVAIPQLTGVRSEANVSAAKSELKNIQTQLELFYTRNDHYPEGDESDMSNIDGISEDMAEGPGGNDYSYSADASEPQEYTVTWENPDGDDLEVTPDGGITTN